jgi:hypothetical protein
MDNLPVTTRPVCRRRSKRRALTPIEQVFSKLTETIFPGLIHRNSRVLATFSPKSAGISCSIRSVFERDGILSKIAAKCSRSECEAGADDMGVDFTVFGAERATADGIGWR